MNENNWEIERLKKIEELEKLEEKKLDLMLKEAETQKKNFFENLEIEKKKKIEKLKEKNILNNNELKEWEDVINIVKPIRKNIPQKEIKQIKSLYDKLKK